MRTKPLSFEEFQATVAELLDIDKDIIRKDAVIYQEIGIDSLGLVTLGVKFQKAYGIEIAPASIVDIRTVGQFYDVLKALVDAKLSTVPA
jgi:acyl carrier protein